MAGGIAVRDRGRDEGEKFIIVQTNWRVWRRNWHKIAAVYDNHFPPFTSFDKT